PTTSDIGERQYIAVTAGGRAAPTTSFGPLTDVNLSEGSGSVWVFAVPTAGEERISTRQPRPVLMAKSGDPNGGRNLTGAIVDSTQLFTAANGGGGSAAPVAGANAGFQVRQGGDGQGGV